MHTNKSNVIGDCKKKTAHERMTVTWDKKLAWSRSNGEKLERDDSLQPVKPALPLFTVKCTINLLYFPDQSIVVDRTWVCTSLPAPSMKSHSGEHSSFLVSVKMHWMKWINTVNISTKYCKIGTYCLSARHSVIGFGLRQLDHPMIPSENESKFHIL